jgi:hypothetical protein
VNDLERVVHLLDRLSNRRLERALVMLTADTDVHPANVLI